MHRASADLRHDRREKHARKGIRTEQQAAVPVFDEDCDAAAVRLGGVLLELLFSQLVDVDGTEGLEAFRLRGASWKRGGRSVSSIESFRASLLSCVHHLDSDARCQLRSVADALQSVMERWHNGESLKIALVSFS